MGDLHPVFKSRYSFLIFLLIWIFIFIQQSVIMFFLLDAPHTSILIDCLSFSVPAMLFSLALWYPSLYMNFEEGSIPKILMGHAVLGLLTSATLTSLNILSIQWMLPDYSELEFIRSSITWRFLTAMMFYLIIVASYYVYIYYSQYRSALLDEYKLKTLLRENEIRALRFQINPHFLFNSLNSIAALTLEDGDQARNMLIKLSDFFRKTLKEDPDQKHPLAEELDILTRYLEIEKIRFADRLEFNFDSCEDCLTVEVPTLILQPLIENAVKHGVYENPDITKILLYCGLREDYIEIRLTNNFDPNAGRPQGSGVGLKNVRDRLDLFYGRRASLSIHRGEGQFEAILLLPVLKSKSVS